MVKHSKNLYKPRLKTICRENLTPFYVRKIISFISIKHIKDIHMILCILIIVFNLAYKLRHPFTVYNKVRIVVAQFAQSTNFIIVRFIYPFCKSRIILIGIDFALAGTATKSILCRVSVIMPYAGVSRINLCSNDYIIIVKQTFTILATQTFYVHVTLKISHIISFLFILTLYQKKRNWSTTCLLNESN